MATRKSHRSLRTPDGNSRRFEIKEVPLDKQADQIEQESRMVLPGIQALFGFQLIAVFNRPFWELLTYRERLLHLVALVLVALAIALVLAPAAYHRQVEPKGVSSRFTGMATLFLTCAMFPLMIGIPLEVYLVARIIIGSMTWAVILASVLFLIFLGVWYIFPRKVKGWRRKNHPKSLS